MHAVTLIIKNERCFEKLRWKLRAHCFFLRHHVHANRITDLCSRPQHHVYQAAKQTRDQEVSREYDLRQHLDHTQIILSKLHRNLHDLGVLKVA